MDTESMRKGLPALLLVIAMTLVCSFGVFAETDARQAILNEASLTPTAAKSQALDNYLDELLGEILHEDMDTYEQVRACYDYVVANTSYGNHMSYLSTPITDGVTCASVYSNYGEIEGFGAVALTAQTGMCNAYASAFILMVRKIGLDADLVEGSTKGAGGGYVYHEWAEVTIGDTVYLFDPQLEQGMANTSFGQYAVFCKTYDEVPGRFVKY